MATAFIRLINNSTNKKQHQQQGAQNVNVPSEAGQRQVPIGMLSTSHLFTYLHRYHQRCAHNFNSKSQHTATHCKGERKINKLNHTQFCCCRFDASMLNIPHNLTVDLNGKYCSLVRSPTLHKSIEF